MSRVIEQDVPEGYKRTEVGVIPEDWEILPLNCLAKIRSGFAKNTNKVIRDPVVVHYLRVANVQDGYLDLSEMSMIKVSKEAVTQYAVLSSDVLMNEGGDLDKLGRGAVWRSEYSPCIHQNHVFVVRCGTNIYPDYLNVWTGSASARRYFMVAGKQTTNLATINKTALGQLPIALPSKKEQTAIAKALSDVDALITSLEKLIAKKRAIKTAAMQQLLTGKKRLPPFDKTHSGYKQTELGEIPEDWEVKAIDSFCSCYSGGTPSTGNAYFYGGELPWITSSDLNKRIIRFVNGRITKLGFEKSSAKKVNRGTLLFALYGATAGVSALTEINATINQAILAIVLNSKNDTLFLFQYLQLKKTYFIDTYTQGGQPNFSGDIVKSFLVSLPATLEEQKAISRTLHDMDNEIEALEHRLTKTQHLKQGMMQELLTGRTRLVNTEDSKPQRGDIHIA